MWKATSAHAHVTKSHVKQCDDTYTGMHMAVHMWASDERQRTLGTLRVSSAGTWAAASPLPPPPPQLSEGMLFAGVLTLLSMGIQCPSCPQDPLSTQLKFCCKGLSLSAAGLNHLASALCHTDTHRPKLRVDSACKTDFHQ